MKNVYIVKNDRTVATLIGQNLSEKHADRRVMAGMMRCNDDYFVHDVEVGSDEDKKYNSLLIEQIKE